MHKEIPELGMIYRYTAGVVFMGTPHRGTDKVQLADMLVLAAKVTWRKPNDELLNALRSNAGVLNQQRANFTTIMDGFSVVCLYESQPTTIGMVRPRFFFSSSFFRSCHSLIDASARSSRKTRHALTGGT